MKSNVDAARSRMRLSREPKNRNPLLLTSKDKTYTKRELETNTTRRLRYNDLLYSARNDDMAAVLILPTADKFEIPRARVSRSLQAQVELLDIYHYLEKRKENISFIKLSPRSFGSAIGVNHPKSTFEHMLSREDKIRTAAKTLPDDAHYVVKRKGLIIEQALLYWLHDQRKKNVPVTGEMMKVAAHFACMVLCDLEDDSGSTVSEVPLSFSAYWFDSLKKQHRISYCQLHGEAASVDLEAIEPELVGIRQLCAQYTPDTIFNCNETGMYVKELDTKSYTTSLSKSGAKALRDCKVSILFCINASGSSLALAKTKQSLRPVAIGEHIPRDVEEEAASKMTMVGTKKGWMTGDVFVRWLQQLDDELSQPILLLLDSAGAHNDVDMRDHQHGIPWRHLCIRRLPTNSTSVTQPLDAGVISAFKRAFLEKLGREIHLGRNFDQTMTISNGRAWTLIPDAWDEIKPSTLRNCFAKTPVLPTEMREELRRRRPTEDEQQIKPQSTQQERYKEQEKAYFEHIIAEIGPANVVGFRAVESRDEQAEEELLQVDEEGRERESVGGDQVSTGDCSSREDPVSSPIADTDIYAAIETLKHLAGDGDVLTIDGLKRVRQSGERGQGKKKLRNAVKYLVRACTAVRDEELVEEVANGHE